MLSETGNADPNTAPTLTNQVAIVTGGGRGVGRTIACHLSSQGARVAVASRTPKQVEETVDLIERAGGTAIAFALDVAHRESVISMVTETERRLGPVDLLVNDAAIVAPFGPSWEVDAEHWWRLIEINLYGSFLCAHAVLSGMTKRRRGRIINLATGVGLNPVPCGSAYVTSKAALIRHIRDHDLHSMRLRDER